MKNDRRSSQKAQRSQYCKRVIHIRLEIPPANCVPQGFQMTIHLLLRNFLGISVLAVLTRPGLTIGDGVIELGFMIISGMRGSKILLLLLLLIIMEDWKEYVTDRARWLCYLNEQQVGVAVDRGQC